MRRGVWVMRCEAWGTGNGYGYRCVGNGMWGRGTGGVVGEWRAVICCGFVVWAVCCELCGSLVCIAVCLGGLCEQGWVVRVVMGEPRFSCGYVGERWLVRGCGIICVSYNKRVIYLFI